MLKFTTSLADQFSVPAYLETAGEKSEGFYANKGSYKTAKRQEIRDDKKFKGDVFSSNGGCAAMVYAPSTGENTNSVLSPFSPAQELCAVTSLAVCSWSL